MQQRVYITIFIPMQTSGVVYVDCEQYDDETGGIVAVRRAISPAHLYAMPELGVFGRPRLGGVVRQNMCAPGDVLYVQSAGSGAASQCVVVTRVSPARVCATEVLGRATLRTASEPALVLGAAPARMRRVRVLVWTPDAAVRTECAFTFHWSARHGYYAHEHYFLTRSDAPCVRVE